MKALDNYILKKIQENVQEAIKDFVIYTSKERKTNHLGLLTSDQSQVTLPDGTELEAIPGGVVIGDFNPVVLMNTEAAVAIDDTIPAYSDDSGGKGFVLFYNLEPFFPADVGEQWFIKDIKKDTLFGINISSLDIPIIRTNHTYKNANKQAYSPVDGDYLMLGGFDNTGRNVAVLRLKFIKDSTLVTTYNKLEIKAIIYKNYGLDEDTLFVTGEVENRNYTLDVTITSFYSTPEPPIPDISGLTRPPVNDCAATPGWSLIGAAQSAATRRISAVFANFTLNMFKNNSNQLILDIVGQTNTLQTQDFYAGRNVSTCSRPESTFVTIPGCPAACQMFWTFTKSIDVSDVCDLGGGIIGGLQHTYTENTSCTTLTCGPCPYDPCTLLDPPIDTYACTNNINFFQTFTSSSPFKRALFLISNLSSFTAETYTSPTSLTFPSAREESGTYPGVYPIRVFNKPLYASPDGSSISKEGVGINPLNFTQIYKSLINYIGISGTATTAPDIMMTIQNGQLYYPPSGFGDYIGRGLKAVSSGVFNLCVYDEDNLTKVVRLTVDSESETPTQLKRGKIVTGNFDAPNYWLVDWCIR